MTLDELVPRSTDHQRELVKPLRHYVEILRRNLAVLTACAVTTPAAALAYSLSQDPVYEAAAQVVLSRQNLATSLTGTPDPASLDFARVVETQATIAKSPVVSERAVVLARVTRRAADVSAATRVVAAADADLLDFAVQDTDARVARQLANAYVRAYLEYKRKIDTAGVDQALNEVSEQIRGQQDTDSALYRSLLDKQQQLSTLSALQTSNSFVSRNADSAVQVAPRTVRNTVLGLLAGLSFGLMLAFLREALDTRLKTTEEVSAHLDLPLLARIPEPSRKLRQNNQLVMLTDPSGAAAEAYRILRANLDFVLLDRKVRCVMITSALHAEGKSTTIANLAVTLARAGKSVILVDFDLRRPTVGRAFGLTTDRGVTSVLLDHHTPEDALVEIELPGRHDSPPGRATEIGSHGDPISPGRVRVLGAGPLPPNAGELLSSPSIPSLVETLKQASDIVLVDAPPLLGIGDAVTLSAHVDGILIMTRLQRVRRAALREVRRTLDGTTAPALGFIASGAELEPGYGYGYEYGPRAPGEKALT